MGFWTADLDFRESHLKKVISRQGWPGKGISPKQQQESSALTASAGPAASLLLQTLSSSGH
ncbi:TPA: hypothetical protein ACH3X1_008091 [Trebouxia sp. C0004]